jgi:hypothetical protein
LPTIKIHLKVNRFFVSYTLIYRSLPKETHVPNFPINQLDSNKGSLKIPTSFTK